MLASSVRIVDLRPLTAEELDVLATVSMIGFAMTVLAFLCVVFAAGRVAVKTRLPGRYGVLASVLLLPGWWIYEQSMGGNLEMTFGPEALLVTLLVYALFSVLFSISFMRMCMSLVRQAPAGERHGRPMLHRPPEG